MEKIGTAPIVGETARERLDDRQEPRDCRGYADSTLRNVSYKIDLFNVWNWKETGTYGTKLTVDRADGK